MRARLPAMIIHCMDAKAWDREDRSIWSVQINCGRGFAPDGRLSVDAAATDSPPSGASPLPQLGRVRLRLFLLVVLVGFGEGMARAGSLSDVHKSNVGGGLPPMAGCQSMQLQLTHRHREQAPSHSWTESGSGCFFLSCLSVLAKAWRAQGAYLMCTNSMWEGACSRWQAVSRCSCN
ncbi:hypothetical protein [Pseudomonas sp. 37 R 15]|nr:hypothetical protein [Pseudomonas sp. 37 R 15]